jgi:hypothetical protein
MAAKSRTAEEEGATEEVPENQDDRWLGWTAQFGQAEDDERPAGPPPPMGNEMPQLYLPEQVNEQMADHIPEHLITEDRTLVDPPGSIALNREIDSPHLDGYAGMEAPSPAATEPNLDSMTKNQLAAFASDHRIADVDPNTQTKAEMIETIEAALAEQPQPA